MIAERTGAGRRLDVAIVLALVVITLAVYSGVSSHQFVNYDDDEYVYENPLVIDGITSSGIVRAFTTVHGANWHPLTLLSHLLDVSLFGLNAGRHHLVSLALHALNAVLLFLTLEELTASRWRSAIVSALFAVHPINVENVAWIAERKSLLSTLAWLLAIGAYVRWTRRRHARDYALLLLVFAAGLLCKPMIVTLPATLLILDVWPLKRLDLEALISREGRRQAWPVLREKLPLFGLSIVSSTVTYAVQSVADAVSSPGTIPVLERLLNATVSLSWYLQKAVVPTGLGVHYPHPAIVGGHVSLLAVTGSIALMALLAGAAVGWRRSRPYLIFGLAWYVVTLLPVLGIIQVGMQARADRYAYVPLIGVFVSLVWLAAEELSRPRARSVAAGATCVSIIVLAGAAHRQVTYWHDSETLWRRTLEVTGNRNPVAAHNLAAHYTLVGRMAQEQGDLAGALEAFRAAVALERTAASLYHEAVVMSDLTRYGEAIPLLRQSIELDPDRAGAWIELGDAQVATGDLTGARESYLRALGLRADKFADYGLAYTSAKLGDPATAATAFERVQRADPKLALDLQRRLSQ